MFVAKAPGVTRGSRVEEEAKDDDDARKNDETTTTDHSFSSFLLVDGLDTIHRYGTLQS